MKHTEDDFYDTDAALLRALAKIADGEGTDWSALCHRPAAEDWREEWGSLTDTLCDARRVIEAALASLMPCPAVNA